MKKIIRLLADFFRGKKGAITEKSLKKDRRELTKVIREARREKRKMTRELKKLNPNDIGTRATIQEGIDLQQNNIEKHEQLKDKVNVAIKELRAEKKETRIQKRINRQTKKNRKSLKKLNSENTRALKEFGQEKDKMQRNLEKFKQINKDFSTELKNKVGSRQKKQRSSSVRKKAHSTRKISFK
ncbi:hypothetical protein [Aquimarina pacifica]|uniref:hypothetical protein n=1 Tax=Aquimarina pacifica TaxID=1296415 RepID=UPI00046F7103|nr:hypothetical protein [Aquimarina pacifica]